MYTSPLKNTAYENAYGDSERGAKERIDEITASVEDVKRIISDLSSYLTEDQTRLQDEIDRLEAIRDSTNAKLEKLYSIRSEGGERLNKAKEQYIVLCEEKRRLQLHIKVLQLQSIASEIAKLKDEEG